MKSINICLITLLTVCSVYAQRGGTFLPLKFDNINPTWTHVTYDSSIVDHVYPEARDLGLEFDGYSHVYNFHQRNLTDLPIIKDGFLYNISSTRYDGDLSGGIIEKIDLETGELRWRSIFDLRSSEYREPIQKAIISGDTLLLFNLKMTTEEHEWALPLIIIGAKDTWGVLKIRKYNVHTGDLIEELISDEMDSMVKLIEPYSQAENQLNIISSDSIEHIDYNLNSDSLGRYIIVDTLNYHGKLLNSTDTILTQIEGHNWWDSNPSDNYNYKRAKDGTLYWIDYYASQSVGIAVLEIHKGNNIRRVDLDFPRIDRYTGYALFDITERNILIQIFHKDPTGTSDLFDVAILDRDGNIVKVLEDINDKGGNLLGMDDMGEVFFAEYRWYRGESQEMRIYKTSGTEFELYSNVLLAKSPPNYYPYPYRIVELDNGDYLLYIIHTELDTDNNIEGNFYNIIRVTPDMLTGTLTSSSDEVVYSNEIFVYPNPTKDYFTVSNPTYEDLSVELLDLNGNIVRNWRTIIPDERLSMVGLAKGIYFYKIQSETEIIQTGKIVIID